MVPWLQNPDSVVVTHRLNFSKARGVFLDQVSPALAGGLFTTEPRGKAKRHYACIFSKFEDTELRTHLFDVA